MTEPFKFTKEESRNIDVHLMLNGIQVAAWRKETVEYLETLLSEREQDGSGLLYHECAQCNCRCNCSDQPCSCCAQQDGWVRVQDGLPDPMVNVLAYNGFRMRCASWMDYTGHSKAWFIETFTHWQPLPSPPNPKK